MGISRDLVIRRLYADRSKLSKEKHDDIIELSDLLCSTFGVKPQEAVNNALVLTVADLAARLEELEKEVSKWAE